MVRTVAERMATEPAYQAMFAEGRKRRIPAQQVVVDEGAEPQTLFLIVSGTVAVTSSSTRGELLLAYMFPGDFFGEMGLFPDVTTRSARVTTRTDCLLIEISYASFHELSRRHPILWSEVASQLARRLRTVNRLLAEMPTLQAADRLALVLQDLAERSDGPRNTDGVEVRVTRQELGKLAGCSRELAGTILREFASQGRVRLSGHTIFVADWPREKQDEMAQAAVRS